MADNPRELPATGSLKLHVPTEIVLVTVAFRARMRRWTQYLPYHQGNHEKDRSQRDAVDQVRGLDPKWRVDEFADKVPRIYRYIDKIREQLLSCTHNIAPKTVGAHYKGKNTLWLTVSQRLPAYYLLGYPILNAVPEGPNSPHRRVCSGRRKSVLIWAVTNVCESWDALMRLPQLTVPLTTLENFGPQAVRNSTSHSAKIQRKSPVSGVSDSPLQVTSTAHVLSPAAEAGLC